MNSSTTTVIVQLGNEYEQGKPEDEGDKEG
jgi:hypothetical protein